MSYKQKIYELKHTRAQAMEAAKGFLAEKKMDDWKSKMDEVDGLNAEIDAYERMLGEHGRFGEPQEPAGKPGKGEGEETGYQKAVKRFAEAARKFFKVDKAAGDMMQEGVADDGGYTVPEDIVTKVIRLRDSKESLLGEVTVKNVKTKSGKRTIKKRSQHKGFATVAEAAKFGKTGTPQYTTLEYEIEKRGGYLPVTNELLEDSDENIAAEAEEWLADESRVTANREIMDVVKTKEQVIFTSLDDIIKVWIGLGSSFRAISKLITNDDGLAWLSTLKDQNGRYLLSPNPADPKQLQLCAGPHVLPVKTYDNDTIPTENGIIPAVLGCLKEGVIYWDRRQLTVKVSDVAVVGDLNAFEQDLTIWRGSLRDDCTMRDDESFVYGGIDTAAVSGEAADNGTVDEGTTDTGTADEGEGA